MPGILYTTVNPKTPLLVNFDKKYIKACQRLLEPNAVTAQ
jgi:hypothetical protein